MKNLGFAIWWGLAAALGASSGCVSDHPFRPDEGQAGANSGNSGAAGAAAGNAAATSGASGTEAGATAGGGNIGGPVAGSTNAGSSGASGAGSAGTAGDGGASGAAGAGPKPDCMASETRPCGTSVGNCEQGKEACTDGKWSNTCVGGVTPQLKDTCAPDDDADCDGAKNEGCSCKSGETRVCGNCGMQACGANGTWGNCMTEGACEVGKMGTQMIACGNCGMQTQTRTCSTTCAWGNWSNTGTCGGEGACAPKQVGTQAIACGNCGMQAQQRTCTDSCGWGNWANVGACGSQGECAIGMVKAAPDQQCGYCGVQSRKQTCSVSCGYGTVENNGTCQHADCQNMPGDERPGYVKCGSSETCSNAQHCCVSSDIGCQTATCSGAGVTTSECDGPEDCPVGQYCEVHYPGAIGRGRCTTSGTATRWCHKDSDCTPTFPYCEDSRYGGGGQFVGQCIDTPPP